MYRNTVLTPKNKMSSGLGGIRRGQSNPVAQLIPPDKLEFQNIRRSTSRRAATQLHTTVNQKEKSLCVTKP